MLDFVQVLFLDPDEYRRYRAFHLRCFQNLVKLRPVVRHVRRNVAGVVLLESIHRYRRNLPEFDKSLDLVFSR